MFPRLDIVYPGGRQRVMSDKPVLAFFSLVGGRTPLTRMPKRSKQSFRTIESEVFD